MRMLEAIVTLFGFVLKEDKDRNSPDVTGGAFHLLTQPEPKTLPALWVDS